MQHTLSLSVIWWNYRDTKAVYDIKSALVWYSDWVKANRAKNSVLNDEGTVEGAESKISPVNPIKAHAEFEV